MNVVVETQHFSNIVKITQYNDEEDEDLEIIKKLEKERKRKPKP